MQPDAAGTLAQVTSALIIALVVEGKAQRASKEDPSISRENIAAYELGLCAGALSLAITLVAVVAGKPLPIWPTRFAVALLSICGLALVVTVLDDLVRPFVAERKLFEVLLVVAFLLSLAAIIVWWLRFDPRFWLDYDQS